MSYPEWRDMLHDLRCIVPTTKHTPRMFMGQEVPALASHYILHPDGVLCGVDPTPWGHPWLGFIQYTLDGRAYVCVNGTIFSSEWAPIYMTRFSDYTDRIKPLPNQESNNQQVKPEQEKSMKQFTKSDLRSGHKVKCRSGEIFTVFLNSSLEGLDVLVGNNSWTKFKDMSNDLTAPFSSDYDIMEVWSNPVYHLDDEGTTILIWKREEKSPEQLAYEALQQKIAEHEQTMKELKEQAEKLKPKG